MAAVHSSVQLRPTLLLYAMSQLCLCLDLWMSVERIGQGCTRRTFVLCSYYHSLIDAYFLSSVRISSIIADSIGTIVYLSLKV